MCAALTLDRLAHRGICHPLHPAHQTEGCSLWRSENREGLSLNECAAYRRLLLSHCNGGRGRKSVAQKCLKVPGRKHSMNYLAGYFHIILGSHDNSFWNFQIKLLAQSGTYEY